MERFVLVSGFAAFFLIVIFLMIRENKKRQKQLLKKLKEEWGSRPAREYTYEQFESIQVYSKKHRKGYFVDDITWNDLDMDTIFMLVNNTQSSVGQEYLYHILRSLEFDQEVLKERNRITEYFRRNEEQRISFQKLFNKLGLTRSLSISSFLYRLDDLQEKSNLIHYILVGLTLISLLGLFIIPQYVILPFLAILGYSIKTYYSSKGDIEPYIVSFSYVIGILRTADQIEKMNIPELKEYQSRIVSAKRKFKTFRQNSFILIGGNSTGGNPLEIFLDYFKIIFHIDIIKFNSMLKTLKGRIREIEIIMENIGELEAAIANGSFRELIPYFCTPQLFSGKEASISVSELYHPMIDEPVANSISTKKNILLTGSNASGKSTFLKTVAINSILAQSLHLALAKEYSGSFYRIYSSMALKDDLENHESYYIVEIKSLKRILDAADTEGEGKSSCVLCFIDEVLRGTNTVERIAASTQILKSLNQSGITCFAATHDIELTQLLEDGYENYHFQEEVKENDILFNYKLYKGRATSRNAIKLLSIIGYDDKIIQKASQMAEGFMKDGVWTL
jgi:DNA mismatch repair ATPase MutS